MSTPPDSHPAIPLPPLPLWTDAAECRARHACAVCRRRVTGRPFRAGLAAQYTLPPQESHSRNRADFPCPHGVPWDQALPSPDAGPPSEDLQDPAKPGCGCDRALP